MGSSTCGCTGGNYLPPSPGQFYGFPPEFGPPPEWENPGWTGWHPWGYGPGYPPQPGCFPPPYGGPGYPPPYGGEPGCSPPPYFGGGGCGPNNDESDFNAMRELLQQSGGANISKDQLEQLRDQALLRGDAKEAHAAEELMDAYDKLHDQSGGIFGLFKHDSGISQKTLFDILYKTSQGESMDQAISEEEADRGK